MSTPNYRRIYLDLVYEKYPKKKNDLYCFFQKEFWTTMDVINVNDKLFKHVESEFNQKHRSYDQAAITEILNYQKKNKLNNTQLAHQFMVSRNSIAKWKKAYANETGKHLICGG